MHHQVLVQLIDQYSFGYAANAALVYAFLAERKKSNQKKERQHYTTYSAYKTCIYMSYYTSHKATLYALIIYAHQLVGVLLENNRYISVIQDKTCMSYLILAQHQCCAYIIIRDAACIDQCFMHQHKHRCYKTSISWISAHQCLDMLERSVITTTSY